MKKKIILVLMILIVILFFSYFKIPKKEINYTILGDKKIFTNNIISKNFSDLIYDKLKKEKNFGFYNKDFIKSDIRIIDVINQIKENELIEDNTIQNILKRTNILILHIGNNELNYKLSNIDNNDLYIYKYLDETVNDYIDLLNILKKYNNNNIIILSNYNDTNNKNNNKYYNYFNKKIEKYSKANNIIFINTNVILNKNDKYLTKTNPVYITNEGNLTLFDKIYSKINKLYLHKTF